MPNRLVYKLAEYLIRCSTLDVRCSGFYLYLVFCNRYYLISIFLSPPAMPPTSSIPPNVLVAIVVWFKRAGNRYAEVVGLFPGKRRQFYPQPSEMQPGDLFVQFLGKGVHF